ncbi:ABC transporter permease [Demequina salsinemoris]|uniref:ABC transporter permease n=1 Tax=Demequina salsinemoris TaxID=577470 RepID=UPI0007852917|nr:hypothetical protein [Demequina salsinemoris]
MTTTETSPNPTVTAPARKGNPWLPTLHGTFLVTRIELLRRRPSTKGWIFYGILLAAILGLGILVSVLSTAEKTSTPLELVLVLVLGAGMLIGPSLSATSINGDSGEGVLAPLQMTHLTAGDLAVGKLLSSWFVAFAVLVTTTPFLVYAYARSGWHLGELLLVLVVILFLVLTATAVGLAWSAIAARAVASVSLAHLTTGVLVIGTLVLFAFTAPLVSDTMTETDRYVAWDELSDEQSTALEDAYNTGDFSAVDPDALVCDEETYEYGIAHTERTAWMVLINPLVVIEEVSPLVNPLTFEEDGRAAPGIFANVHQMVSSARIGPTEADAQMMEYDECADIATMASGDDESADGGNAYQDTWEQQQEEQAMYPRTPWLGLGLQVLLLVGAMAIVTHRLRVPYRTLRTGTRVA